MMKQISKKEAMDYLHNYGIIIHFDNIYSLRYKNFFDADSNFVCYESRGCVILKNNYVSNGIERINFDIHQISNEADVCAVWHYVNENEKTDNVKRGITIYALAPLPNELTEFRSSHIFICRGKPHEDSQIRKMIKEDEYMVKELCKDSLENDSHFGKSEAESFYSWFEKARETELLGIFSENKLAGLVSVGKIEKINIAEIYDIFIHKDYRRLGFGKRLTESALSLYPNIDYIIHISKQNTASIELAKSLGFEFAGSRIFALFES